jgi:hypothetical protein
MSATMHTQLYRDYFSQVDDGTFGDMSCLSVGTRRFPVQTFYAEDLSSFSSKLLLSTGHVTQGLRARERNCDMYSKSICKTSTEIMVLTKCSTPDDILPSKLAEVQYKTAVALVRAIGVAGTSVLIFVSGILDITELVTMFQDFDIFDVVPIHSDIPIEEQELAFVPTPIHKVKVVVATNAAESSITIPDCDVVICLGTQKSIKYNSLNHRKQLVNCWISKASATQRAGRTGRVRPGSVYRLYSKKLSESMNEHQTAEVYCRPLEDVILDMWVAMEGSKKFCGVTALLQQLIESPDTTNIDRSYQSLYEHNFITQPNDRSHLTAMGRLSGALPVDISLGRLITQGVILGVAGEAIILAAALSLPKSPSRFINPLFHKASGYIVSMRRKFFIEQEFDGGVYSEPLALLNLFLQWRGLGANNKRGFCNSRGLLWSVMQQFDSLVNNILCCVSSHLKGISIDVLNPTQSVLNRLRMLLLWNGSGNVLYMKGKKKKKSTSVKVHNDAVTKQDLDLVFDDVYYDFSVVGKQMFTSPIGYWDPGNVVFCLAKLLNNLIECGRSVEAECMWVILKSRRNGNTVIAVVVPHSHKSLISSVLSKGFYERDVEFLQGIQAHADISELLNEPTNLFVTLNGTNSEVNRFSHLEDKMGVSLSVVVPICGSCVLTAVNCVPEEEKIQSLFSQNDDCELKGFIARQIPAKTCVISFEKDDAIDCSEAQRDAVEPLRPDSSFMSDLPLGHRLLNFCRQLKRKGKRRDKFLVLSRSDKKRDKKALAPGIAYAPQQIDADQLESSNKDSSLEIDVEVDCICAPWKNLRSLKTTSIEEVEPETNQVPQVELSSIGVFLSKQSILSCSYNNSADPFFAVAHTTLLVGNTTREPSLLCSGVTFFPKGMRWISLALLCTGNDCSGIFSEIFGAVASVPILDSDLAKLISELLLLANAIEERSDIVELIDKLFVTEISVSNLDVVPLTDINSRNQEKKVTADVLDGGAAGASATPTHMLIAAESIQFKNKDTLKIGGIEATEVRASAVSGRTCYTKHEIAAMYCVEKATIPIELREYYKPHEFAAGSTNGTPYAQITALHDGSLAYLPRSIEIGVINNKIGSPEKPTRRSRKK